MKYIANLKDAAGNIITGHEQTLEGTREEVMADYLYWLNTGPADEEHSENEVDLTEVESTVATKKYQITR